jgi:hypothetical protein
VSAAGRVLEQGANPADLSRTMRLAAYEAVFAVLSILDEGYDPDAPEDAPGWRLMETAESDRLTGRDVGGLHEDILTRAIVKLNQFNIVADADRAGQVDAGVRPETGEPS